MAELQLEEPAVTLPSEVLKDSAPVLEGLKVTGARQRDGVQPPDASGSRGSEDAGLDGCSLAAEGDGGLSRGVGEPGGAARPWLSPCSSGRDAQQGLVRSLRRLPVTFQRGSWVLTSGSLAILP